MTTPSTDIKPAIRKPPEGGTRSGFWKFARELGSLSEAQRVLKIKSGFKTNVAEATKLTFDLSTEGIVRLLDISPATYGRLRKSGKTLDITASERLDRLATIARIAEDVFENKDAAAKWMATPNAALGGVAPIMHCETEIGARQVRRILNALEWGGVA